ncbi:MAG: DUF4376 domain-containing protein [Nitrosomonas sp.]|nr:DUF4376 domain-containing protein [Nitrosomonas sp.]
MMPALLVNSPNGKQQIIRVEASGAYFDPARVLWDERIDGPLPQNIKLGKMQRVGDALVESDEYLPAHIDEARTIKRQSLKAVYESAITQPIEHNDITWAAGKDDQSLLATVLAVGSVPPEMYWRDINQVPHAMSYTDLQALAGAILSRALLADSNLMTKLDAVDAAETIEAINAIEW